MEEAERACCSGDTLGVCEELGVGSSMLGIQAFGAERSKVVNDCSAKQVDTSDSTGNGCNTRGRRGRRRGRGVGECTLHGKKARFEEVTMAV